MLATGLASCGLALLSACTIVSGWSDLQSGPRDGGAEDRSTPGSDGSSGSTDTDGSSETDGSSSPDDAGRDSSTKGYDCGATTCAGPTMGCCVDDFEDTTKCTTPAQCGVGTGFWIGCDRTSACADFGGACCWDVQTDSSRCMNGCKRDQIPICHPDEGDCKAPKTCNPSAGGVKNLYQCN